MRKVGAGRIAALLWLGAAVSVAPAQAPVYKPEPTMQGNWFRDLFGSSTKDESKPVDLVQRPTTKSDRGVELQRLMNAWQRRKDVCHRLREIALATNDTNLEAEADRLDSMAWELYLEKSKRLPGLTGSTSAAELEAGKSAHGDSSLSQESPSAPASRSRPNGRISPEASEHTVSPEGER